MAPDFRKVRKVINSWSRSIKHMCHVHLNTHKYLIEPLGGKHLKTMLYSRYTKFVQSIHGGIKDAPIYLLELIKHNTNTITGRNVKKILYEIDETDISKVNLSKINKQIKFCEIPENEKWRINLIKELTNVKLNNLHIQFDNNGELTNENIDDIIYSIAAN